MKGLRILGLGVCLPGTEKPGDALSPAVTEAPATGWFDPAAALPGRGYRRLPAACQYLLAATRNALADGGEALTAAPAERRGIVVGTNNAGLALLDEQDRTILGQGADAIAPLSAPYFAMSLFASRLATEHGVHGFTLTVNSPRTAAFDALRTGARALAAGRAEALVIGATEETLPAGEPGAEGSDTGAVALICAPHGSARTPDPYGTVEVRNTFLAPGADPGTALRRDWDALTGEDRRPPRVDAVLDDSPVGGAVAEWLADRPCDLTVSSAGAGALTPVRHLAAALARGDGEDRIVVTAAAEGNVAFARLTAPPGTSIHNPLLNGSR